MHGEGAELIPDTGMAPVQAYLARIGLVDAPAVGVEGLRQLQRAHRLAIAFENLDIPLGRGIATAPDAVAEKLVGGRRGGYCFEHNGLFVAMLTAMGFTARPLLARVWLGIADVGFGGSFTPPLPLEDGAEASTPDGTRHRLRRTAMPGDPDGVWLLERNGAAGATDGRSVGEGWQPQYGFALTHVIAADIAQCSHWTSTRAGTRFTTACIASLILPDGFAALSDQRLSIHRGSETEVRLIDGPEDYRAVLATLFGIILTAEEVAALPLFATAGV